MSHRRSVHYLVRVINTSATSASTSAGSWAGHRHIGWRANTHQAFTFTLTKVTPTTSNGNDTKESKTLRLLMVLGRSCMDSNLDRPRRHLDGAGRRLHTVRMAQSSVQTIASLHNTRVGTATSSCIPGTAACNRKPCSGHAKLHGQVLRVRWVLRHMPGSSNSN